MFDTHLHTDFSTDSHMCISEALAEAEKKNLGLIITEHMDIIFPAPGIFKFNPVEYFENFNQYRSDKLMLGIELGIHEDYIDKNKAVAINYPFDYVLGSLHFLGNNDIFDAITYEGKNKREVYEQYFIDMEKNIRTHSYIDSLGHMDFICRYATYEKPEIYFEEYRESIEKVLKCIIENDIALEINSRRLAENSAFENAMKIYRRYSELGGTNVTMGSDAHYAENIGMNFGQVLEIIRECNLKPVYFKERKLHYVKDI